MHNQRPHARTQFPLRRANHRFCSQGSSSERDDTGENSSTPDDSGDDDFRPRQPKRKLSNSDNDSDGSADVLDSQFRSSPPARTVEVHERRSQNAQKKSVAAEPVPDLLKTLFAEDACAEDLDSDAAPADAEDDNEAVAKYEIEQERSRSKRLEKCSARHVEVGVLATV